ncbi:uncharacterized protein LOC111277073 isoform X1 [Durio zibethinus]|uniref:Uncharacterized protein LOC111277073 isoform X1 n=1 Tax=Durio zibethinus TaxID=66656 RepID=A0A6P5WTY4_DURZI|nr:uncharacterized protein LOC111277073 isoform X1 [Durio zibethinus]XP_022718951.1 uncharacterized protein LOC111277073 isoform X1 [Durio zibethinus]
MLVIEVILKFEEICLEYANAFSPLFPQADEKEGADESDKVFLKRSEKLVEWLREAEEEEEEEEDEDRDNHAMAKPWYIFAILFSCG